MSYYRKRLRRNAVVGTAVVAFLGGATVTAAALEPLWWCGVAAVVAAGILFLPCLTTWWEVENLPPRKAEAKAKFIIEFDDEL